MPLRKIWGVSPMRPPAMLPISSSAVTQLTISEPFDFRHVSNGSPCGPADLGNIPQPSSVGRPIVDRVQSPAPSPATHDQTATKATRPPGAGSIAAPKALTSSSQQQFKRIVGLTPRSLNRVLPRKWRRDSTSSDGGMSMEDIARANFESHKKLKKLVGDGAEQPERPPTPSNTHRKPTALNAGEKHEDHSHSLGTTPTDVGSDPPNDEGSIFLRSISRKSPSVVSLDNNASDLPGPANRDLTRDLEADRLEGLLQESESDVEKTPTFRLQRSENVLGRSRLSMVPEVASSADTDCHSNTRDESTPPESEDGTVLVNHALEVDEDSDTAEQVSMTVPPLSPCSRFLAPPSENPPSPTTAVLKNRESRRALRRTRSTRTLRSDAGSPVQLSTCHSSPVRFSSQFEMYDTNENSPVRFIRHAKHKSDDLRGQFRQRNFSLPMLHPKNTGLAEGDGNRASGAPTLPYFHFERDRALSCIPSGAAERLFAELAEFEDA